MPRSARSRFVRPLRVLAAAGLLLLLASSGWAQTAAAKIAYVDTERIIRESQLFVVGQEKLNEEFDKAKLALKTVESFALDYARTLAEWHERFEEKWDTIQPMGFDERFRRMWKFYLSYCEAGFKTGRIDVAQYALAKS